MILSDLENLQGMNETLDTKLEGKPNFPGHGVYTGRCALTWNNLFSRYQLNPRDGSREIFEKPHFVT